jgi:hypothetical protein
MPAQWEEPDLLMPPLLAPEQVRFLVCSGMEVGLMGASEKRLGRDLVESSREAGLPPSLTLVVRGEGDWGSPHGPHPIAAAAPPDAVFFSIAVNELRTQSTNPISA